VAKYKKNIGTRTAETLVLPAERIQKILARAGLGSRRKLETAIQAGDVLVNDKIAVLGTCLEAEDKVTYNHCSYQVIASKQQQQTLLYNKPLGEITSHDDPEGRRTIFDRLPPPEHGRWIAVGRLDINTSGLLILTTDGELANAMMHPSSRIDREYACRIHGQIGPEQLQTLRNGVELEDGMAKFNDISVAGGGDHNQWFQVTIMEGRNREVRRLWATQNVEVSRLQRVRYGAAFLPKGLLRGRWHWLSDKDHRVLREDVKLTSDTPVLSLKPLRGTRINSTNTGQRRPSKKRNVSKRGQRHTRNDAPKRGPSKQQKSHGEGVTHRSSATNKSGSRVKPSSRSYSGLRTGMRQSNKKR